MKVDHGKEKCTTRPLRASDGPAFRALRLETFKSYGDVFANSFKIFSEKPDVFWRQFCTETEDQCLFGLFDADELVGVVGVEKSDRDTSGETALWTYAYLKPKYRGKKLSQDLYAMREEWTRRHPRYKRAILSILEGCNRSVDIHRKNGAHYLSTEQLRWNDGPPAPWHWYEKRFRE